MKTRDTIRMGLAVATAVVFMSGWALATDGSVGKVPVSRTPIVRIEPLGPSAEFENTMATAVNYEGFAAGYCFQETACQALAWIGGRPIELGTLGGENSSAIAINASGQVVGQADTEIFNPDGPRVSRGFVWRWGRMESLGAPLGGVNSAATDINDDGAIIGWSETNKSNRGGFLLYNGEVSDITPPFAVNCYPAAVNNVRAIAGTLEMLLMPGDDDEIAQHAFLWDGQVKLLATLPNGVQCAATDINDAGQVVGWSDRTGGHQHASLWQDGKVFDLGTLGGPDSAAAAINNGGVVVGWSYADVDGSAFPHAFMWVMGEMTDLNTLLPAGSGWLLTEATSINDKGQIVGMGLHKGAQRAFLLSPSKPGYCPVQPLPGKGNFPIGGVPIPAKADTQ